MLTKTLTFDIEPKHVMNSNKVIKHFMQKSNMTGYLRNISGQMGVERHDSPELAKKRREALVAERDIVARKARAEKSNRKSKKPLSDSELQEKVDSIVHEFSPLEPSDSIQVPYMFEHFSVRVDVLPPTRRRLDPPNLYPTVKALIDGLTDASWWADDNFSQLLEVSFRYGGLSGDKNWKVVLTISEVDNTDDYILSV